MVSIDKEPTTTMANTETKKDTPSETGTKGTESSPTREEETMKTEATPGEDATIEKHEDDDSSSPAAAPEADHKPAEGLTKNAIDEMTRGMVYASLAITDDKEDTLKKMGKANPWQVEALKIVAGSEKAAHKPLTQILDQHMNLKADKFIDISGVTKGGHFLDTQGYIAHNDTTIVLSYRCTTSAFDWLTNLNTTSSAWEIEEDAEQGYSGFCSGFDDLCGTGDYKPRVHTGFYNNFLATLPHIKEHIDPLLAADQPPRTLYVVGHSLGGGVATVAACYFLLEFDWTNLPHRFVGVTAGAPRSCATSMKSLMDERLGTLGDSAKLYRLVKDRDVVAKVPPTFLAFQHLVPPVSIGEDGSILAKEAAFVDVDGDTSIDELRDLVISPASEDEEEKKSESEKTRYEKWIGRVPRGLRDHMPEL
eukprot:scaffold42523_cov183-Amphora_coffeaeformis.AAC.1